MVHQMQSRTEAFFSSNLHYLCLSTSSELQVEPVESEKQLNLFFFLQEVELVIITQKIKLWEV